MIGAGGSGNTALVAPAMRALPVGVPKVLVSTVASGNVAPYVGPADIAMIYSVTDVQGLNRISRRVLGNAAHALAGMMRTRSRQPRPTDKPALGLTMFGVTTPCVQAVTAALEARLRLPRLPRHRHRRPVDGEAGRQRPDRRRDRRHHDRGVPTCWSAAPWPAPRTGFGAIARTGVPYVGSVGALDMVNFGAAGHGAGAVQGPEPLCPQSPGHADADDARGERARSAAGSASG